MVAAASCPGSTLEATDGRCFGELLDTADVVVTGYRPGALEQMGLTSEALAERRPGLVIAQLSAWPLRRPPTGWSTTWQQLRGEREGFDAEHWLTETDSPMGRLRHALSPVSYEGGPVNWRRPPGLWGTDAPVWDGA
jgi:hypothetical protein